MSRTGIIDTHAHLDDNRFDSDRDQLIEKLGLELDAVINQGCTLASSAASIALAEKYPFIYAAVGIHPEDLATVKDDSYLDQLAAWAAHPKVVAIGEIGLDYYWKENEPREVQLKRLRQQVDLARQVHLPVVIHDREAHAEMYDLLRKYKPRGALHCYSGSADDAAWLVEQGMYLGFGGAVTYKGAKRAAKVLAAIPHDRALLETDCPYMAPEPVRGTRNDSRNIAHVAAYIGTIWDMDAQAVLDQTAENARRCFGL